MAAWIDAVPAVPLIGVQTADMPLEVGLNIPRVVAPVLDRWGTVSSVARQKAGVQIDTTDGARLVLQHNDLLAQGALRVTSKEQAASFYPRLEHSDLLPYSQAAENLASKLVSVMEALSAQHRFSVRRVGVVAHMRFHEDALPPGIEAWIQQLGARWTTGLVKSDATLVADVGRTEDGVTRCHHGLGFDRGVEVEARSYRVSLDWQIVYDTPMIMEKGARGWSGRIREYVSAAQAYFEEFAFDVV